MAPSNRDFRVIQGGASGQKTTSAIDTGLVDGSGYRIFKDAPLSPSGGGGGDNPMVDIAEIKQALKGAFAWLSLLSIAFGVAFLWFLGAVNNGFDSMGDRVREVEKEISAQGSTLRAIDQRLERMEEKIDTNQRQGRDQEV